MKRLRFSSGLSLGLALGVPIGALLALLLVPTKAPESAAITSLQVQELTHKLEAAQEARERADHQVEQFQKLAEQMTQSFQNLETRFKTLEEQQRQQTTRALPTSDLGFAAPRQSPTPAGPAPTGPQGGAAVDPQAAVPELADPSRVQ